MENHSESGSSSESASNLLLIRMTEDLSAEGLFFVVEGMYCREVHLI